MRESIPTTLMVLFGVALVAGHPHAAPAQDKAQITDVFKERLVVDDPKVVSVRQYDVPPGWATPCTSTRGTCSCTSWRVRERWRRKARYEPARRGK